MLNFLQANNIMDMTGLDEKFKTMTGEQLDIQGKLKPVERRLGTLKKHIEQADIYSKYKGKKPLTEAEQIRKAFTISCGRNSPAGNRIWSDNKTGRRDSYHRPVVN